MNTRRQSLVFRLLGAVLLAFAASTVLTWVLHDRLTARDLNALFERVFGDVSFEIRDRVDKRLIRQAMVVRDRYYEMRGRPWWGDPDESSRRLRELADELGVDEVCIADADGLLTHSARRDEVGALNFRTAEGQAREFTVLLDGETEFAQPLMPNSLRGEMIKYVGVWLPDGGLVQVGGSEKSVRNLSRTAVTGITEDWHVSGDEGGIYITTEGGTVISHPVAGQEGALWADPGDGFYCKSRVIEGFPVHIVVPKKTTIADRRLLVATSTFLNGAALVFAAILVGIVISRYVRKRMRELTARDMAMAASIQESAMPRVFPPFPGERRMDIFASMKPARDIGGDFYDFYFAGPGRLVFLVADVSGKGVPAALFMMRAKTALKGIAQTGLPLAEVVRRANDELSRDNDANMFVTAWIGELNLATGAVTYVNAGHNPPLKISGASSEPAYVRARSGMMLGALPGLAYKAHTLKLAHGDMLYLYTDGITEQHDGHGKLFGEDRLLFSIKTMLAENVKALEPNSSPLLGAIFSAVIAHGAEIAQADDCTQLVVRYNGVDRPVARRFPVSQESVAAASVFLDEWLATLSDGRAAENQAPETLSLSPTLHVILDEISSNILKHSGASEFEVELAEESDGARIVFRDDGTAYNPLAHDDPDVTLSAEMRPIGGLGIFMVRRMAKELSYARESGCNVLTVRVSPRG